MAIRKTEVCLCSNNLAVSTSANTVTSLQFSLLYVLCHPTIFTLIFSTDLNLLLLLYSSVTPMPRFYSLVWKDCTSCLVVLSATQSVLCSLQTLAISCNWLFHFIVRSGKPSLENGVLHQKYLLNRHLVHLTGFPFWLAITTLICNVLSQ